MLIIGFDSHTRYLQVAMLDEKANWWSVAWSTRAAKRGGTSVNRFSISVC